MILIQPPEKGCTALIFTRRRDDRYRSDRRRDDRRDRKEEDSKRLQIFLRTIYLCFFGQIIRVISYTKIPSASDQRFDSLSQTSYR